MMWETKREYRDSYSREVGLVGEVGVGGAGGGRNGEEGERRGERARVGGASKILMRAFGHNEVCSLMLANSEYDSRPNLI